MTRYTRSQWGARPPEAVYELEPNQLQGVALHWPATTERLHTVPAVMEQLRDWQAYHMDVKGWSDIAYQLAFDQLGNVYQLRGLQHRSAANGDTGPNLQYGAFLLIVAQGERPSEAMQRKVRRYIKVWRRLYPRARLIVGHNDVRPEPTLCPGPIVGRMIDTGVFG